MQRMECYLRVIVDDGVLLGEDGLEEVLHEQCVNGERGARRREEGEAEADVGRPHVCQRV